MAETAEIDCPDMPGDGAARYRVMVTETQRMQREVAAMAEKLRAAEAEKARLGDDAVTLAASLRDMTARAEKAEAVCRPLVLWNDAVTREEGGADEWPAVEEALEAWQATQVEAQADG